MSAEPEMGLPSDSDRDVLRSGTDLNGYTIERKLGQGGFGIVYLARHNELQRIVAIKEYLPIELAVRDGHTVRPRNKDCQDVFDDGLKRFLGEARRVVEFRDHPNIVSCTDFFRANGTAYLVMEYEDAVPLSELIREREANGLPLGEAELKALMYPLLAALTQIHSAGILHRDVKPSNILVRRRDQQPVLIDFGAAKQVVSEHSKSMAPYTDGYAALEQVGNGELGPWTDMYAIGAVMWRIVASGNPPWERPEPIKVESRASAEVHGHQDPLPSAQTLGAERFSLNALQAIDRCLLLREGDRIQSSDELRQLLQEQSLPDRATTDQLDQPESDAQLAGTKNAPTSGGGVRSSNRELVRVGWASAVLVAILVGMWLTRDQTDTTESPIDAAPPASPSAAPNQARSPFTVMPIPSSASVSFVNRSLPYEHGMALEPGNYEVSVAAPGHHHWSGVVQHGAGPTVKTVRLRTLKPEVPVARTAEFRLQLEPPNALVSITGQNERFQQGMDLPLGPYEVEVSAPGYTTRRVEIEHNGAGPYRVALAPTRSPFFIEPEPANAFVTLLSGSETYRPGIELAPGEYRVRVTAPGHEEWSGVVEHGSPRTMKKVRLQKREAPVAPTARFLLVLDPPSAEVKFVGRIERFRQGMELPLGWHAVDVSAAGFKTQRFDVLHDGTDPYEVTLESLGAPFYVEPEPPNAIVTLLTGNEPYKPGMELPPGRYRVSVRANGYEKWEGVVQHGSAATRLLIPLKPAESTSIRLPSQGGCSPAIESTIEGDFDGWDGDTIVKLTNGQIWQQSSFTYRYTYRFRPDVLVFASGGGCKMLVEGMDDPVGVIRIR